MKELNFTMPSSWDEVTLEMFDVITSNEENPYEKIQDILEILTGLPKSEIKELPATVLESAEINKKLSFMTKEPRKRMPVEKLTLNGKRYEMSLYPAKWTAAQYLDYNAVLGGGPQKKMARLIACFCVPEGKKYGEGYDFDKLVDEIYEHMPVTVAMGYASFFQLQLTSYAKALSAYTEKKKKKSTRKLASRLKKKSLRQDSTTSGTPS
jgi:hypothetical protein